MRAGQALDVHGLLLYVGAHWSPADMSLPEAAHTEKVYSLRR